MMGGMPTRPAHVFRASIERFLGSAALGGAVLFVVGAGAGTWWTLDRIHQAVRESVRTGLTTVLANAREATHHWVTRQQVLAAGVASDRALGGAVEQLVASAERPERWERARDSVTRLLDPAIRSNGLQGFWILSPDGHALYRWPASLPSDLPPNMQEPFDRALDGLPTISSFAQDPRHPGPVAALAPIRDAHGHAARRPGPGASGSG